MAKHTPGPWRLEQPVNGYAAIYDRADRFIVALAMASAPVSDTEREANARLIAAAPDLYAALEQAVEALECLHACSEGCANADIRECDCLAAYAWDNAHDALRKAKGEE